ncbi:MAG: hypothetical protein AB1473_13285 [Thermodesulfobacteriota bacterium]
MNPKRVPRRIIATNEFAASLKDLFGEQVFLDIESSDRIVVHRVDAIVASMRSPYQQIDLFRTPHFGLVLALDGIIQAAQSDEYIYHELLIHPAALLLPRLDSALVLGGGDGCAARELLKYRELNTLELVDIDQTVVDLSRVHFKELNQGALDDPRVKLKIGEGETFLLNRAGSRYDLIVADLTEPYTTTGESTELSRRIYSPEFYHMMKTQLNQSGILVVQTGGITYIRGTDRHHLEIIDGVRQCFRWVATAYAYIHSYDQIWTITLASDYKHDLLGLDVEAMLNSKGIAGLRYYDRASHVRAFHGPRQIRESL